jgi:transposase
LEKHPGVKPMNTIGGAFLMAKKGHKFASYTFELKMKTIQLRLQGMTKQRVAQELGIADVGRLKVWMRQYRLQVEFGLMDHRGKRQEAETCGSRSLCEALGNGE